MSSDGCALRKHEDNLNVCGIGVVILSAWDVFKAAMQFLTKVKDVIGDYLEQFEEGEKGYALLFFIVFIAIVLLGIGLIFWLHAYIGFNASRAAKRLPYKKGYYAWAIILLVLSVLSLPDYIEKLGNLEEIETTVASLIIDLTSIYILGTVVVSTRKIKALRSAQTQE
ncbi:hypothetical protein NXH67_07210 [Butyrivibrio sp. DSM 10294]|uniref:hypothetical protein n=1 Tax=Butyrivibrio sp. DSM 10294 TaxID=2972457 RepID=UPI00234EE28C|nr:hypothetical protein [Butyrivibrio sp. DSM 10294]MDC7293299.1 hypothetical protein [Butyrivibrio sp. DSM 10294]